MQTQPALAPIPLLSPEASDSELAARAAHGEDAAFDRIMRRHNRLLFRTARAIVRCDAEAEDVLQEAYLRAWRALATFRADAKLSTWLTRIVINEALSRLRRRGTQPIPLASAANTPRFDADATPAHELTADDHPDHQPEAVAMRAQMRRLMEAHIDSLPEAFRTVFMLRAVEELSVEEVAAMLQVAHATVRTRYFRARRLLRESLSRDVDVALADAFAFDGQRCDRIVATVLARLARERGSFNS